MGLANCPYKPILLLGAQDFANIPIMAKKKSSKKPASGKKPENKEREKQKEEERGKVMEQLRALGYI